MWLLKLCLSFGCLGCDFVSKWSSSINPWFCKTRWLPERHFVDFTGGTLCLGSRFVTTKSDTPAFFRTHRGIIHISIVLVCFTVSDQIANDVVCISLRTKTPCEMRFFLADQLSRNNACHMLRKHTKCCLSVLRCAACVFLFLVHTCLYSYCSVL